MTSPAAREIAAVAAARSRRRRRRGRRRGRRQRDRRGKGLDDAAGERAAIEQCLRAAEASSASESKTARLLRLLSRLSSPAIVFSEYRDTAVRLRERIAAMGRPVVLLHGGLRPDERVAATREFARGGVVMVATDAASEGLNLHHSCRLRHPLRAALVAGAAASAVRPRQPHRAAAPGARNRARRHRHGRTARPPTSPQARPSTPPSSPAAPLSSAG